MQGRLTKPRNLNFRISETKDAIIACHEILAALQAKLARLEEEKRNG